MPKRFSSTLFPDLFLKMKVLVILGHPQKGSFNHAIAEMAVNTLRDNNHEVIYHDLYEEKFDPILPGKEIAKDADLDPTIQRHCDEVTVADGIIIVHPNWWGQPPAILKGWVDRILRAGIAYEFAEEDSGEGVPIGLLKARTALIFNTSNTPYEREITVFGDPLEMLWKNCIFDLCGVRNFYRRMFGVIITSSAEQRAIWLKDVKRMVSFYFPEE